MRALVEPRSASLKDAAIEEIAERVSQGVRGMFELRRKNWTEIGTSAQSGWRPAEE